MLQTHQICKSLGFFLALGMLGNVEAPAQAPTPEQVQFFEAKVRPVLVEGCRKCHGPEKQKGGLRLDSRSALLAGGDTGPAIVPGKPDESLLILAVKYDEDGPKMPPSKKLGAPQVQAFTEWVKMGAPWPNEAGKAEPASTTAAASPKKGMTIGDKERAHWAFRPLRCPEPPKVEGGSPQANPIDAFVLAGLQKRGLAPNPPATKVELIRRATFDLTGLPPTPAEVDAFLKDARPEAFEAVVDRLLASPRYGEKWGRHWLDLVRYAETNSYERDNPKPNAWRFRDYVIKSFNDDKPYDRFVIEQLAGDELPKPTTETITATGYYRLGIWDDEPVDREQARFDSLDDLVGTTGQVFLGLTIDCARCHDHKLDPIPQKDYYKFVSFFRNVNHYRNGGPTDEMQLPESERSSTVALRRKNLEAERISVRATIAGLEGEFLKRYVPPPGVEVVRHDLEELKYKFYRDTWEKLPEFDAIKFEGSGDLPKGLFDLKPKTRDEAFGFVFEGTLLVPETGEYLFHLDSDDGSRLIVDKEVVATLDGVREAGHETTVKRRLEAGRVPIRLEYFQKSGGMALSVAWSGPGFSRRSLSASGRTGAGKRVDVRVAIQEHGEPILGGERVTLYVQARHRLDELRSFQGLSETVLRVTEPSRIAPETFVLGRGNAHSPGEKVEPGFLEVLGNEKAIVPPRPQGTQSSGRRSALAGWIASPSNPLTARVMANRVFQHHFGRGIVQSPNNFGLQGDRPTHPELLDRLASELIANGWRLKPLHKLMMMSDAYRRSSRPSPAALAKDPINDTLWRFDMRRLSAEEIRDAILAVDGRLNLAMGGPGVYPEIPAEVMAGQSVPGKGWMTSLPEDSTRRSVYIHVKRSLLVPILEGFDLAETDRSTPSRFSTTQPTQALGMLNGKFLNDEAAAFALRLAREAGDDLSARIKLAFRLAVGREATPGEVRRGLALIETLQKREGTTPAEAMNALCLVVLNLNEFLYLD